jgi:hypothetical protein
VWAIKAKKKRKEEAQRVKTKKAWDCQAFETEL